MLPPTKFRMELGSTFSTDMVGLYPEIKESEDPELLGELQLALTGLQGRLTRASIDEDRDLAYMSFGIVPRDSDGLEHRPVNQESTADRIRTILEAHGHEVDVKPGVKRLGPGGNLFEDLFPPKL